MSKDNNDMLWWAITGLCDQFQNKKIGRDRYVGNHVYVIRKDPSCARGLNFIFIALETWL